MKTLTQLFLKGLAAILPLVATIAIIVWLGQLAESTLQSAVQAVLPKEFYKPGMGVALGLLVVLAVGLLLNLYVFRAVWGWAERLLDRLPGVKTIYGGVRDLMGFLGGGQGQTLGQVVMVEFGPQVRLIGFVTRQAFADLPPGIGDDQHVAVYLPMSYGIGGYTAIVARTQIHPVDMSIEDAMRFAITAGVSAQAPKTQS